MTGSLLVLGRAADPPTRALRRLTRTQEWHWAYLGADFPQALRVAQAVGTRAHRLPLGEELVRVAAVTARELVEALARLRGEDDPFDWWTDSLSERSPYLSPLIRECAILRVVERWLGGPGPLLLFVEGEALRAVIAGLARGRGWQVVDTAGWLGGARSGLRRRLRRVGAPLLFLVMGLARLVERRLGSPLRSNGSTSDALDVLCLSFIGPADLARSPRASDPYWGPLLPWLGNQGYRVGLVPVVVGRPLSPTRVVKALAERGTAVVLPEDHLRVRDYLWAACRGVYVARRPLGSVSFDGIDIRGLCGEERDRHGGSLRLPLALLQYRLGVRLSQNLPGLRGCLYPFENQVWERALLLGLRRGRPGLEAVGFQHSTIAPLEMNYFPAKNDWRDLPLPDRLICHGERFRQVLEGAGYPSSQLAVGGSLRYPHLLTAASSQEHTAGEGRPAVLVLLSIVLAEAAEVLWKAEKGLAGMPGARLIVRAHPFMPLPKVLAALGRSHLPPELEEGVGSLEHLLVGAACVVYRDTSAAFETAVRGIPCVYVASEVTVDNDPLDLLGPLAGLKRIASSPAEIRSAVEEILGADSATLEGWRRAGSGLRGRTLTAITSGTLTVFLPGREEASEGPTAAS
ncbi:MAG: hypothetical protein XU15_C0016G0019 [candidate division NC10 bacterium CSP1-5]|nr:MAG: hypothetical protein XU15_C0016G0019 [candidate division NC10 bacterium CSP1-5]